MRGHAAALSAARGALQAAADIPGEGQCQFVCGVLGGLQVLAPDGIVTYLPGTVRTPCGKPREF